MRIHACGSGLLSSQGRDARSLHGNALLSYSRPPRPLPSAKLECTPSIPRCRQGKPKIFSKTTRACTTRQQKTRHFLAAERHLFRPIFFVLVKTFHPSGKLLRRLGRLSESQIDKDSDNNSNNHNINTNSKSILATTPPTTA